jgi:1-acyl-sn-glycerol-3-phosphate acyltransferase
VRGLGLIDEIAYAAFWAAGQALLRPAMSLTVEGPPPPREGGYLLVANHLSYADPAVVMLAAGRPVRFLMTEDFYDLPGLRWFFRWMRALRVREAGSNLESLREAREALRAGDVVGLFPEGRLSPDGRMGPGRPGAAALASLAGAPIVPMRIRGAYDVWRKGWKVPRLAPVHVVRGDVLPAPGAGRRRRRETTRAIMEALRAL